MSQADAPTSADLGKGEYVASNHASDHNVLVVGTLGAVNDPTFSVDSSSTLDLGDNDLIIHTGSSDAFGYNALAAVQGLAYGAPFGTGVGGRDGGAWDGKGLTSSVAEAQDNNDGAETVQLAVTDNTDLPNTFSTWKVGSASETVGGNDIIVKYTYTGDFNLDGKVDLNDYRAFSNSYDDGATTGNEWALGDTNDDGKLTINDYRTFAQDYGNGTGSASATDPYPL
jgi:hypothetical protein